MIDEEIRKLAAIMFTDMVGYSALSQRDSQLALELLEEHRQLLRQIFPRFHGTEIKTIGDAFLVEFNSALEAAQCAIEIQRTLAKRNADARADRQIELKIGIHIGDVVHRGGDVYGDGVNIASRIEPLAGAGGICVSMDVERQIRNAVETHFEKLAPTELKNISVPMELFRIVLPWEHKTQVSGQKAAGRKSCGIPWHEIVLVTVLLAIAVAAGVFLLRHRSAPRASGVTSAAPAASSVPEKSIAVLPFENFSDDKSNAYFADGVQDEILTDLAKIADLKVISRTSVLQYKDTAKRNLPEIAQALKVAHVLEGSVQRAGDKIRVTAQLIDARTDAHLWAQRFDGGLSDVFAIQSEIAQKIADQLQAVLSPKEKAAIAAKPTSDLAAYDLYLRATELERSSSESERKLREEVRLLEEATSRDSSFVPALCALARAHLSIYWFNFDHTEARLAEAKKAIEAAERIKPDAGEVHLAKALLYYWGSRDYEAALAELHRARASLPNDADAVYFIGAIERRQGHHEQATRDIEDALKLDPHNALMIGELSGSYEAAKRFTDAARLIDDALRASPNDFTFAIIRAGLDRDSRADLRPYKTVLTSEAAKKTDPDDLASSQIALALDERDYAAAAKALTDYKAPYFANFGFKFPREFYQGFIERGLGDGDKAQSAFLAARERAAADLAKSPEDPKVVAVLGQIDASLGHKEEAAREGERAVELLPVTKDALDGPVMLTYLASIYAETGQPERALDVLERVAPMNWGPVYGDLKLGPWWDPLRGNPRFEKIVASLAPKDTK